MSKLRLTLPATSLIKEYIPDMIVLSIFFVVFDAMRKNTDFEKELGFYGSYHQDKVNQIIHLIFIPAIWWSINVWMCCKLGRALLCFALLCSILLHRGRGVFSHVDRNRLPSILPADVPILKMSNLSIKNYEINYGTLMLTVYCGYYCTLHFFSGAIFSLFLTAVHLQASVVVTNEKKKMKKDKSKKKEDFDLPSSSSSSSSLSKSGKQVAEPMTWKRIAFIIHAVGWFMQIVPGHGIYEGVKPALVDSLGQALGVAPFFAFMEGLWMVGLANDLKEKVAFLVAENRLAMCAAGGSYPWC